MVSTQAGQSFGLVGGIYRGTGRGRLIRDSSLSSSSQEVSMSISRIFRWIVSSLKVPMACNRCPLCPCSARTNSNIRRASLLMGSSLVVSMVYCAFEWQPSTENYMCQADHLAYIPAGSSLLSPVDSCKVNSPVSIFPPNFFLSGIKLFS
jgi:hypothetical protein